VQLHYFADAPELSFRRTGIGIHAHPIPSNEGCLSTANLSALPSLSAFSSPGISRATFRSASGECAEACSCACECGSGSDIETTLKRRDPASLLSDDASEITGAGITKSVAAAKQAQLKTACRDCMAMVSGRTGLFRSKCPLEDLERRQRTTQLLDTKTVNRCKLNCCSGHVSFVLTKTRLFRSSETQKSLQNPPSGWWAFARLTRKGFFSPPFFSTSPEARAKPGAQHNRGHATSAAQRFLHNLRQWLAAPWRGLRLCVLAWVSVGRSSHLDRALAHRIRVTGGWVLWVGGCPVDIRVDT
jgi:hypothetical protein